MLARVLRTSAQRLRAYTRQRLLSRLYASDLDRLAQLYGTDKWGSHFYTQHYQAHFAHLRRKRLNILEIGVGGHADPRAGGASLRMWKAFFPRSVIHAIDIHDKTAMQEDRIRIYRGSQSDKAFLLDTFNRIGSLDVVIDDGSHVNEHVITTFETLFPLLNEGGIYAVEDTQTSYWPSFGGDSQDLRNPRTIMNFFQNLADCINHAEIPRNAYEPSALDRTVVGLHFYHNLIFVDKGRNDEGTNKPHTVAAFAAGGP